MDEDKDIYYDSSQVVPNLEESAKMEVGRIGAPRFAGQTLNPKKIVFEEHWERLEAVLNLVMDAKPFESKVWDNSFFDVYSLCTVQCVVDLYAKFVSHILERVRSIREELEGLYGQDLINTYTERWETFDRGVRYIQDLSRYMNRMMKRETNARAFAKKYPELEQILENKNLHISEAARKIWRSELLVKLNGKLYDVIWDEFTNLRNKEYAQKAVKGLDLLLDSFISVCFPTDDDREQAFTSMDPTLYTHQRFPMPTQLQFYINFFEDRFLQQNREYFKTMMVEKLTDLDMYDYMTQVTHILAMEEMISDQLLFQPTVKKLIILLRKIFILEQLKRFDEVVPGYVKLEQTRELEKCHNLLDHFPDAATILVQEYENHISTTLEDHLSSLLLSPSVFTETVCAKHVYYNNFNKMVFRDSQFMNAALRRALEGVVNKDRDNEKFYAAKMLARHMDLLLKKQSKNRSNDLEDKLDEAVIIFRYIKDKDTFHKIFQRLFSIRLLSKMSVSLDTEAVVIEKLKDACGHDYTSKLSRMFQDCIKSKNLMDDYRSPEGQCSHSHNSSDEFMVIQTCAWPVISSQEDQNLRQMIVPLGFDSFSQCYKQFYEKKHSGRILKFAYHVSTADITINIGSKKCLATMTIPQAIVLLLFEDTDILNFDTICQKTGLSFEYVCSCIKALVDFKLLKVNSTKESYTGESLAKLRQEFEAQRARVHLQPPALVSKAQETNPIPSMKETIQDRKVAVECAIVRAMKTRKVMKHQELVDFVLSTISSRFVPERSFLKSSIEGLIDKHFLQRTDNIDEYEYLP